MIINRKALHRVKHHRFAGSLIGIYIAIHMMCDILIKYLRLLEA